MLSTLFFACVLLFSTPAQGHDITCRAGDLNDDGGLNVLDIVQNANVVLDPEHLVSPEPSCRKSGDVTCDGGINVLDIVQMAVATLADGVDFSFGVPADGVDEFGPDTDGDWWPPGDCDCDESESSGHHIHWAADEICDGIDNNCSLTDGPAGDGADEDGVCESSAGSQLTFCASGGRGSSAGFTVAVCLSPMGLAGTPGESSSYILQPGPIYWSGPSSP